MITPEINKILYCTDMGDHMRPVFRFTIEMAKRHNAKITMLHVIEPLTSGALAAIDLYIPDNNATDILHQEMKKSLEQMQLRLNSFCEDEHEHLESKKDCEIISKVKVVSGKPAEAIINQAEQIGVDLIVVGTHTNPSMTSGLLGSTARSITHHSKIPVLVVPVYEDK